MKDFAGAMPSVALNLHGKEYSAEDKKLVDGVLFYMQELVKLFPANARLSLLAAWDSAENQRELVNIGTLSNVDIVRLLVESEQRRMATMAEAQDNG